MSWSCPSVGYWWWCSWFPLGELGGLVNHPETIAVEINTGAIVIDQRWCVVRGFVILAKRDGGEDVSANSYSYCCHGGWGLFVYRFNAQGKALFFKPVGLGCKWGLGAVRRLEACVN